MYYNLFLLLSSWYLLINSLKDNKMYKYQSTEYTVVSFIHFLTKGYRDNKALAQVFLLLLLLLKYIVFYFILFFNWKLILGDHPL